VQIAAHQVGRYVVPAQLITVRAGTADEARLEAVREVHRRGELPPWKPLARASIEHARVV
jgi:hypothetical protein